jgi:hypothetical protein
LLFAKVKKREKRREERSERSRSGLGNGRDRGVRVDAAAEREKREGKVPDGLLEGWPVELAVGGALVEGRVQGLDLHLVDCVHTDAHERHNVDHPKQKQEPYFFIIFLYFLYLCLEIEKYIGINICTFDQIIL